MGKHVHIGVFDSDPLTHELIPAMLDEKYTFHFFTNEAELNKFLESGSLNLIICETELQGKSVKTIPCEYPWYLFLHATGIRKEESAFIKLVKVI